MNKFIPQAIWLGLFFAGLGVDLVRDGEPKKGKHSFFGDLVAGSLGVSLLFWGGFFDGWIAAFFAAVQ